MKHDITVETYLTYDVAVAALPIIADAFDALDLTPDDEQWSPLFQVQLALEHIIKQNGGT